MATKTFTIEINGIEQSVNAVDNLIDRLDDLENRLESISNDGIDVSDLKSSLQSIRNELENATDGWEDFADKIGDAANEVSKLERSVKDVKFDNNDISNYNKQVENLSDNIEDISNKKINLNISNLEKATKEAKEFSKAIKEASNTELDTKININLDEVTLQFDDVDQAIGVLEDKLNQLASSGKQDTKMFADITSEVSRLKNAINSVDEAVTNVSTGGLNQLVGGLSGLTSLASIGEGINQLFGLDNGTIDEAIQKFAALSLILQGLTEVQKQLQTQTTLTSKVFNIFIASNNAVWSWVDKGVKSIPLLGSAYEKLGKSVNSVINYWRNNDAVYRYSEAIDKQRKVISDTSKEYGLLVRDLKEIYEDDLSPQAKGLLDIGDTSKARKELTELYKDLDDPDVVEALKGVYEWLDDIDNRVKDLDSTKELKKVKEELDSFGIVMGSLPKKMSLLQRSAVVAVNGIKALAVAFKALVSSTVVLLVLQVALEAVGKLLEKIGKLWTAFAGDSSLVNALDTAQASIDNTNSSLEKYIDNLEHLAELNVISNQTKLTETINEYNKALDNAINNLQKLNSIQGKSLADNLNVTGFKIDWLGESKNIDEFTEKFNNLAIAVQNKSKWYEFGKNEKAFGQAQIKVIEDIIYRINNLDLSKGSKELEDFIKLLDTDIYATSLANIDKLFPEDETAKVLKLNIDQIRQYYSEIQKLQRQQEIEAIKVQDSITSNNIASIKDRMARERAEFERGYELELRDAADNEELKLSIIAKYNTQRIQLLKRQQQEIQGIQNQISSNEIAALSEGLDKNLKQIELNRQQEIQNAINSEILVNEQIESINKKYDKQILDTKREFYNNRLRLINQFANENKQIQQQIAQLEAEIATSRVTNRQTDRLEELGFTDESLDNIRRYYDNIRDIQIEEASKLSKINVEKVELQTDVDIENEKQRNRDRLLALEDSLRQGLITQEEYDREIQKEMDNHYLLLETITRNGEQKILDIQKQTNAEAKNYAATAINERINALNEAYSNVEDNGIKTTNIGIVDFAGSKKELTNAKKEYQKIFNEIAIERDNLQKQFDKKEITFNDFRQAKKELDSLEKSVSESIKDVNLDLNELVSITVQSITQYVGQYIGILGGLWSTYNDIQMQRIEEEQARLDEEYDMLEDAYRKQEDLTKGHMDKLKDIEDELKTSRGDRRAHLVEQLNAERQALIASLQEEQKIDKEKEANAKKQDALEKKRREQEKKNSIVQATINTFTAVTNALAVQPWFVGLALSAVALAMGMAQVSNIKKQKYAKGGILVGKSHNAGGIPVGMTGIEVEGGEYVINKRSTQKNMPLIDYINKSNKAITREDLNRFYDSGKQNVKMTTGSKFANGGVLPNLQLPSEDTRIVIEDDRPIVAQIVDIVNSANNYRQIQIMSGLVE